MRPPRRGRVGGSQEGMVSLPWAHRCPRIDWCQVKMLVWYALPLAPAGKAGTSLAFAPSEDRFASLTDPSPSSTKGSTWVSADYAQRRRRRSTGVAVGPCLEGERRVDAAAQLRLLVGGSSPCTRPSSGVRASGTGAVVAGLTCLRRLVVSILTFTTVVMAVVVGMATREPLRP